MSASAHKRRRRLQLGDQLSKDARRVVLEQRAAERAALERQVARQVARMLDRSVDRGLS